MTRRLALAASLAAAAALGLTAGAESRRSAPAAVNPNIAFGAQTFVQFGCSACHGLQGKGGVSPYVPPLAGKVGAALTVAQLTTIISKGLGVVSDPKRPYMPIWGPVISRRQIAGLVLYIKAGLPKVRYADPVPVPRDQGAVVAGMALYVRNGCINCHGPNGLGGVPNPAAPDKSVPALTADFRKEFNTDAKIRDVIATGSVIGKAPIASMPHWGGIIPPADLDALVAYIKTFK
jgi:mono/diheme cytochrome c family protein